MAYASLQCDNIEHGALIRQGHGLSGGRAPSDGIMLSTDPAFVVREHAPLLSVIDNCTTHFVSGG